MHKFIHYGIICDSKCPSKSLLKQWSDGSYEKNEKDLYKWMWNNFQAITLSEKTKREENVYRMLPFV